MFFNSKKKKKAIAEIGHRNEKVQDLFQRGYYDRGLELAHETMHMAMDLLPQKHPLYAASLCNLASGYKHIAINDQALNFYQQALNIQKPAWGRGKLAQYLAYADTLSQIGILHHRQNKLDAAEKAFKEVMQIRRKKQGKKSLSYIHSVYDLAALYRQHQQFASSEKYYLQAYKLAKKLAESRPAYFGRIQSGLAHLYLSRGKFKKAAALYEESVSNIKKNDLGNPHLLNDVLSAQGIANAALGRPEKALESMLQYIDVQNGILERVFTYGSLDDRRAFLNEIIQSNGVFLSLIEQHFSKDSPSVKKALEMALGRKTLAVDAIMSLRQSLAVHEDPELKESYRKLNKLNAELAEMKLAGPKTSQSVFDHQHEMMQCLQAAQTLEENINVAVSGFGLKKDLLTPNLDSILEKLPAGSAYIEIVKYDQYVFEAVAEKGEKNWQNTAYLAFVVNSENKEGVKLVLLGEASEIEAQIRIFRTLVTQEKELLPDRGAGRESRRKGKSDSELTNIRQTGEILREVIFTPLSKHIKNARQVFLAADGELTHLPFEVLPMGENEHLIDEYHFVYLSSGRDLLRPSNQASPTSAPLVMADPDFNLVSDPSQQKDNPLQEVSSKQRSYYSSQLQFRPLPGTRGEGIEIAKLLGVEPYLQEHALENVLRATTAPYILHLATHGYFLPPATKGEEPRSGNRLLNASEDILLRSGIALAGANTWLKGKKLPVAAGDALLNGEDVAALDLSGTELVVLSACETGLGEVFTGEGVLGLRRSFMIAGTKSIVASLWKVPDAQTQELMISFYKKILAGLPRGKALREAQLDVRAKYPHPLYWGAFICIGESGPLPGRDVVVGT